MNEFIHRNDAGHVLAEKSKPVEYGILLLAPRHERRSAIGMADAREGGWYIVGSDGSERGPFDECPEAPGVAAHRLYVQHQLLLEPRP